MKKRFGMRLRSRRGGRLWIARLLCTGGARMRCRRAIASLQAEDEVDWAEVAALYGELVRLTGSAVVELNRAVAVAKAEGAEPALEIVDRRA